MESAERLGIERARCAVQPQGPEGLVSAARSLPLGSLQRLRLPSRRIATPYLWSMSSLHRLGKFVGDGVFNPNAPSDQCGAATVLKFLHLRGDIALTLDRMSEGEPPPPPAITAAVEAAKAAGRATIDEKPPVSPDFDTFLKGKVPDLKNFS